MTNGNNVWINIGNRKKYFGEPLRYRSVRKMLKRVGKKAEIEKDVNPHAFRHARATHLANHFTEAQMCEYFGWVQGSDQPATYVHLSGRNLDHAIRQLHGLEKREEDLDEFDIKTCPNCSHENEPERKFCEECSFKLGQGIEERIMNKIKENPDKWGSTLLEAMEKKKEAES